MVLVFSGQDFSLCPDCPEACAVDPAGWPSTHVDLPASAVIKGIRRHRLANHSYSTLLQLFILVPSTQRPLSKELLKSKAKASVRKSFEHHLRQSLY